jgi:hypothetical protein
MAGVEKVRKRDGREVPFDPRRIAGRDRRGRRAPRARTIPLLADELAAVVKLFLDRDFAGRTPSVDDIGDLVERVLIETGNAAAAKAYILNRHKRAEQMAQLSVRANRPVAVSSVGVTSPLVSRAGTSRRSSRPCCSRPISISRAPRRWRMPSSGACSSPGCLASRSR